MAATTTLLGLVTPTQGTLSGTWGDTVNYGISDYVDISVAGTLTLTNDGAVTLANTTGSSSGNSITSSLTGAGTVTAQFAIVRVTGTLTVAKVVTGPSYSKTYTVVNAATGGIVTFKASGQTGVSVAVGESAFVYFNGTDYVKIVGTATAGAAGGSNTQVQFNSSGILSGSANLTWNGTSLSATQIDITAQGPLRLQDTTGGEYVALRAPASLAGNYTLTFPADDGTSGQALITDGSGVLSWSTAASGDVYGPGSSTDNAVARFDSTTGKLLQNSVVIVGDTGDVTGVGTLSATTLTLTNALGTASGGTGLGGATPFTSGGVVYASSTSALATGSALTFDGTNLGVTGNTNGIVKTNVTNNNAGTSARADSGVTSDSADILMIATSAAYTGVSGWADTVIISTGSTTSGGMLFNVQLGSPVYRFMYLATNELMRLTSTGLGIGTNNPQARLQALDQIKVSSSDQSSGIVALGDGSSTSVNVGIGRWNGSTNVAGTGGMGYFSQGTVNSGGHYFYTGDAAAGSQTERLRIAPAGQVVVNGNTVLDTALLTVNCTAGTGSTIPLSLRAGVTADGYGMINFRNQAGTQGGITCNTGSIAMSGLSGITFVATQVPSAGANTLDDYEEGTWTPQAGSESGAFTATYNGQVGKYVKIGNRVWATFDLTLSSRTLTGSIAFVYGLPFQVANNGDLSGSFGAPALCGSPGSNFYQLCLYGQNNASYMYVTCTTSNTSGISAISNAFWGASTRLAGGVVYNTTD